jgi:hypothetical protein
VTDIRVVDQLEDVAKADWDRLVGDDGFYLSYDWLRFIESEQLTTARYLLASDSGILCGALPLYQPRRELRSAHDPEHAVSKLGLSGEYLIAGAMRGFRTALLVAPDRPGGADDPLPALLETAAELAAKEGYAGVTLPYLSTSGLLDLARVIEVRASFHAAEAEFVGCGDGLQSFSAQVRHRVRSKIRSDRARFAEANWQVLILHLDECWQDAVQLLVKLEGKYGNAPRTAGLERTLSSQAKLLSPASVVFACADEQGIAGLALCYRWRSTMYGRIVGFDYDRLRNGCEYFNLAFYEPIEYCRGAGLDRHHAGLTAWEAKGFRGALMRPRWSAAVAAGSAAGKPRLELVGTGEEHLAEFANRHISYDPAEWAMPVQFAAEVRG